jgi:hypothetical protein
MSEGETTQVVSEAVLTSTAAAPRPRRPSSDETPAAWRDASGIVRGPRRAPVRRVAQTAETGAKSRRTDPHGGSRTNPRRTICRMELTQKSQTFA